MTRKKRIAMIRAMVATHGECTREAVRIYIESRMSHAAFKEACDEGLAQFKANQKEQNGTT
jgi:hypothetical protein